MSETLATGRKSGGRGRQDNNATDDAVSAWFVREILPLETNLMRFLRSNWKNESDIVDLRQEIYARIFDAARTQIPDDAERFLIVTARNHLINTIKHEQVVSIEVVADIDMLHVSAEAAGPDQITAARDELRHLQTALNQLPPRIKEAITLAYIEDLSVREIAARMGITKSTVSIHLAKGIRALSELVQDPSSDRGKKL